MFSVRSNIFNRTTSPRQNPGVLALKIPQIGPHKLLQDRFFAAPAATASRGMVLLHHLLEHAVLVRVEVKQDATGPCRGLMTPVRIPSERSRALLFSASVRREAALLVFMCFAMI